jgi:hypothetical protein
MEISKAEAKKRASIEFWTKQTWRCFATIKAQSPDSIAEPDLHNQPPYETHHPAWSKQQACLAQPEKLEINHEGEQPKKIAEHLHMA